jgi:hypothetical protein
MNDGVVLTLHNITANLKEIDQGRC